MNTKYTFDFKEFDAEGLETLQVISDAGNFNQWTFDTISPFCSGKIIEIGSGIGNISECFIREGYDLTISDIRKNYRDFLKNRFPEISLQNKILPIDLVHPDFEIEYQHLVGKFDTVFSLNVIEHIEDDLQAVANCKKLLRTGGKLITLMPALQSLYNNFDKELFHFRRYNRKTMRALFEKNDMRVIKTFYFNSGGIVGWFISGSILKNKIIPANQMKVFDKMVPLFRLTDKLLMKSVGLSVICVGQKS